MWLVADMDEGILRVEPTRRAAVDWAVSFVGARVLQRYHYGPGSYSYVIGFPGEDSVSDFFIGTRQAAQDQGFDVDQDPLYPVADDPFEEVPR